MAPTSRLLCSLLLVAVSIESTHASPVVSIPAPVAFNESNASTILTLPLCSDVQFNPNASVVQTAYCVSRYKDITTPHLAPRSIGDYSEPDPDTPQDDPDFAWFKDSQDGKKDWCSTGGSALNRKRVKELCNSIPDGWKLGRVQSILTKTGCLCRTWMNYGEVFGVCNCDRCDAVVVDHLRQKCKYLEDRCVENDFNSGYFTQEPPLWQSAYTFLYSVRKNAHETSEKVHNYVRASLNTSCLSGDPFKKDQDWSGALHCEHREASFWNFWNFYCY